MKNIIVQNSLVGKILLLLSVCFLASCDGSKDAIVPLGVNVDNVPTVLVINGQIEKDQKAWVQLSYSLDIDTSITTPIPYEKNAKVKLTSNNGQQEEFKYAGNGIYYGSNIVGEVNKTYTMTIEVNGKTYTATSTMFKAPGYQSAWVNELKFVKLGIEYVSYDEQWIVNDPSNTRNRYLFQWWRNGVHDVRID